MGWVGAAAMIASTAMQAYGQMRGGQEAKNYYDYNAAVAKQEAEFQKKRTEYELAAHEKEVKQILAKQRTAGAASGVGAAGIGESILRDTLSQAALDEQMIRAQGDINVWRAKTQRELYQQQGSDFRSAGFIHGPTTLLGGLSRFDWRRKKTTASATPASGRKSGPWGIYL
jgi:hypothetical protein